MMMMVVGLARMMMTMMITLAVMILTMKLTMIVMVVMTIPIRMMIRLTLLLTKKNVIKLMLMMMIKILMYEREQKGRLDEFWLNPKNFADFGIQPISDLFDAICKDAGKPRPV